VLEHIVFLRFGVLYLWHLMSPVRGRAMSGLAPVAYMASTKVLVGAPTVAGGSSRIVSRHK
jgi:hypothetical protein